MKSLHSFLFLSLMLLFACGKTSDQSDNSASDSEPTGDPNQALYDEVMDVHDEVMPKMEDIYKLKSQIQERIANSPDMVAEKKAELERLVLQLDSANNAMMDWMHKFNPLPDSADQEQGRAYLESELEKIRQVKEVMLSSIEAAKSEADQKK